MQKKFPGKMLAYNCSPSFNWKKKLDDATIATALLHDVIEDTEVSEPN